MEDPDHHCEVPCKIDSIVANPSITADAVGKLYRRGVGGGTRDDDAMVLAAQTGTADPHEERGGASCENRAIQLDAVVLLAKAAVEAAAAAAQAERAGDHRPRIIDANLIAGRAERTGGHAEEVASESASVEIEAVICSSAGTAKEIFGEDRRRGHC